VAAPTDFGNWTPLAWTDAIPRPASRVGFYHSANNDSSVGAGWYRDDVSLSSLSQSIDIGVPLTNVFSANGQSQYFVLQARPEDIYW